MTKWGKVGQIGLFKVLLGCEWFVGSTECAWERSIGVWRVCGWTEVRGSSSSLVCPLLLPPLSPRKDDWIHPRCRSTSTSTHSAIPHSTRLLSNPLLIPFGSNFKESSTTNTLSRDTTGWRLERSSRGLDSEKGLEDQIDGSQSTIGGSVE